jgi:DNA (cytosine-5)-methyltransferase 1
MTLVQEPTLKKIGALNSSQDGQIYDANGLPPCLSAGHGNMPKVQIGTLRTHKDGEGFREMRSGLAPTLGARPRQDGSGQAVVQLNPSTESGGKQPYQQNRVYDSNGISPALDHGAGRWGTTTETRIRRLTEIEVERLQGLPDNWTKFGIYTTKNSEETREISSTQRYKLCGNGVTVNVTEAIALKLKKYFA